MTTSRGPASRATAIRPRCRTWRWTLIIVAASTAGLVAVPTLGATSVGAMTSSAPCSSTSISLAISTDQARYGPGTPVKLSASIRNTSPRSCTVAVGPTSPTFSVRTSQGVVVWSGCGGKGGLSACAQYLVLRTLAPGTAVRVGATWDQRSGTPLHRVAVGTYRASVGFARGGVRHSVAFQIVTAATPRTLVVDQIQSGGHYVLHRGDHLIVRLASSSLYTWSAPTSSNEVVLVRIGATAGASASATFVAKAPGQAEVNAVDNPTCYPQCLPPSRLFTVSVRVEA
jgi:hypothetical protein